MSLLSLCLSTCFYFSLSSLIFLFFFPISPPPPPPEYFVMLCRLLPFLWVSAWFWLITTIVQNHCCASAPGIIGNRMEMSTKHSVVHSSIVRISKSRNSSNDICPASATKYHEEQDGDVNDTLTPFFDASTQICQHWSIPCVPIQYMSMTLSDW